MAEEQNNSLNQPQSGMKLGKNPSMLAPNEYSLGVNLNIQSSNGDFLVLSNETSNLLCTRFKNFKVINATLVKSLNFTFYFLVNIDTNESEIGYVYTSHNQDERDRQVSCPTCNNPLIEDVPLEEQEQKETCQYFTFVNADCLNLSIDFPITAWVKVDDCNIRIYFTDKRNPIRYIDFLDFQKVTINNCPKIESNDLDCEKIKIFKDVCYPKIFFVDEVSGGENTAGVYQFAIAYSDAYGNFLTNSFYVSNKIDIWDKSKSILLDDRTDYTVAKSIKLRVEDINREFDWFNLVVLKTVDKITTPYLVGTFSNTGPVWEYTYSGIDKNIKSNITIDQITKRSPIYDKGKIITESNGISFIADLVEPRILNLQPLMEELGEHIEWQTVELNEGDYANPVYAEKYQSELRDEVYSLAIEFTRTHGLPTARFHIPGRKATAFDLEDVTILDGLPNPDVFNSNACSPSGSVNPRWTVYNTATNDGFACGYNPDANTNTVEGFYTCDKTTSFYQDNETKIYYTDYDVDTNILSNPIIPCDEYPCSDIDTDCLANILAAFPTGSITRNDCNIIIDSYGGTKKINIYSPSGNSTVPIESPSGYPNPCNNTCITATCNPQEATNSCITPLVVKLNNNGIVAESTWYKFTPSTDAQQFNITSPYNMTAGHSFTLRIYSSLSGFCADNILVSTQTSAFPYFIFTNLTIGVTYYLEITTSIANPVIVGVDDFYQICTFTPTAINQETINLPNIAHVQCNYIIEYTVSNTNCNALVYEKGKMGYWESTERYPCNKELWGDLADKPIRHHKLPDCKTSPHYKNTSGLALGNNAFVLRNKIYPLGIRIDVNRVKLLLNQAVAQGFITEEEKLSFCGYRILRGNRKGNESIIAKGIINDVWKYRDNVYKTQTDILYPNYPYNSREPDVFNRDSKIRTIFDVLNYPALPQARIKHPYYDKGFINNKYVFHSANTHFNNPGLGSEIRLELEATGVTQGQFNEVINHAKYQYVGAGMLQAALGLAAAESSAEDILSMATIDLTLAGIISAILHLVALGFGAPGLILSHYYEWLDLLTKLAPYTNFAWYYTSIGRYTDYLTTNITDGNIRRGLNDAQYLTQGILTVKDGANNVKFNNYKRESSVYLDLNQIGSATDIRSTFLATALLDNSRWCPNDLSSDTNNCNIGIVTRLISSYYGSIKNNLSNQYGQIDQIEYIDTGYNGRINWGIQQNTNCDTIFGGDTFIGRHYYRTQMPLFLQDRIGDPLNTDVQYNELGNIGWPAFFFNYPATANPNDGIASLFGNVAFKGITQADYNLACEGSTGGGLYTQAHIAGILAVTAAGILGIVLAAAGILSDTADTLSVGQNPVYITGKMFLYAYGEPGFIGESDYNTDLRYGTNYKEGNFYPNVGDMVAWTQPTSDYNLIDYDNTYNYNRDYSKQNKENLGYTLNVNFEQKKEDCKILHPNRVIYSLQDNDNNDRFDGNLSFPPNNYYDFPKSGGKLTILRGVENNKVLVIQEDQASVFNSYVELQTNLGNAFVGNNNLFSQSPTQYIKSDLGFAGSQVPAIISTEEDTYWVDNKRGHILALPNNYKLGQVSGARLTPKNIISEEDTQWFKEFLPFKILKDFPDIDITNNYKWFGMALTYDSKFKRIFITKRDAEVRPEYKNKVTFNGTYFQVIEDDNVINIEPTNSKYFCNQSWTLGYSVITKMFISFYSFTPNYYSSSQNYFSSGVNYSDIGDKSEEGLWNHLLTNRSHNCFYGKKKSFIIEYVIANPFTNTTLNSIEYEADFLRWQDNLSFYKVNGVTYNKALIYSQNQTTGNLELVVSQKNNMFQLTKYPKISVDKTEILVDNVENFWRMNTFNNIVLHNGQPIMTYNCNPFKELNPLSISYKPKYITERMTGDFFVLRLENDKYTNYEIVHKFSISKKTESKI